MKSHLVNSLFELNKETIAQNSLSYMIQLFGHSIFLGLILSILTYVTMIPLMKNKVKEGGNLENLRSKVILGSSNILFLCVGLTGVMILVNNNLARALSIGATMALIRFRVKLGPKNLGSNLLFGIIVGVACGVQEVRVAWVVTIVYILLQTALFGILKKSERN